MKRTTTCKCSPNQQVFCVRSWIRTDAWPRFGNFFNHIDNFASEAFLFVTSGGIAASRSAGGKGGDKDIPTDPEGEPDNEDVRDGEGAEG